MRGTAREKPSMRAPPIAGAAAQPARRTRFVTPEATIRSSGRTTAITQDWRVGTSISASDSRTRKSAAAIGKEGTIAAEARNKLDGICVKTIVFTNPIQRASRAAARWERVFKTRAAQKRAATISTGAPNRSKKKYDTSAAETKPPPRLSSKKSADSRVTTRRPSRESGDRRISVGASTEDDRHA